MNKAFCLLVLFVAYSTGVAAEPDPAQPSTKYFTKLRMDYAHRKDFDSAWKIAPEHRAAMAAYQARDYKRPLS